MKTPPRSFLNQRRWLNLGWDLVRPKKAYIAEQYHPEGLPAGAPQKHCIILHGHNSTYAFLNPVGRALRQLPGADSWHFWQAEYDSHWKPFPLAARELNAVFRRQPYDFSNTVLVGYSMGGIVARQMAAQGFPCSALVSICTPHEGFAPWLPPYDPGTLSITHRSAPLAALNRNPGDVARRDRYHFFAITYADRYGGHAHDGLVTARSALGESLGAVAWRHRLHLKYRLAPGIDPHVRGMSPAYLSPVLQLCTDLFARL